jgi:xylulokinase
MVFESPEVTGRVSREGAKYFGLAEGTPVVGGGGDQAAGAVGNGIIRAGDCTISLGTSGVVFAPSSKPPAATGTTIHAFCHAVPRMWHTMGVMLSAGGSAQWFRNTMRGVNPKFSYRNMDALAAKAPAGADGLIFLPYLTGERTPHNDPDARGVFAGLTLAHDISHMARAALEGVAFGIRDSADLMRELGVPIRRIYVSGGGAQSDLWCAIIASALARPVKRLEVDQGPAMGAALLAGVGAGVWKDVAQATKNTLRVRDEIRHVKQWTKAYIDSYKRYRALYPALKDYFKS